MARVIQVIETFDRRGKGTDSDPMRRVKQFFTFDGELIFEIDPLGERETENGMD